MSVYLLIFVIFLHGQDPQTVAGAFPVLSDCQIAEGMVITKAEQDPTVDGYVMPVECVKIDPAKKS